MHVFQAICNTSQLSGTLVRLLQDQATTHKLSTVHMLIPLNELIDVPIFHPLRNQSKPVFI